MKTFMYYSNEEMTDMHFTYDRVDMEMLKLDDVFTWINFFIEEFLLILFLKIFVISK